MKPQDWSAGPAPTDEDLERWRKVARPRDDKPKPSGYSYVRWCEVAAELSDEMFLETASMAHRYAAACFAMMAAGEDTDGVAVEAEDPGLPQQFFAPELRRALGWPDPLPSPEALGYAKDRAELKAWYEAYEALFAGEGENPG